MMEDSGFDSDRMSSNHFEPAAFSVNKHEAFDESDDSSNNNLEVAFRGTTSGVTQKVTEPVSDPTAHLNTCRVLQRKLEIKVEKAKRNYSQLSSTADDKDNGAKSSGLIPINRLQIPGFQENQPLVEYKTDNSDDEVDDMVSFFPSKMRTAKRQDLSDTFSIQEMTIDSGSESDSQNLELLTPTYRKTFLDSLFSCSCLRSTT